MKITRNLIRICLLGSALLALHSVGQTQFVGAASAGLKQLHGHVPNIVSRLTPVGRLPATNQMRLAIGVPLRDPAGLEKFLGQLYDPASPVFRQYLTPEEFTAKFGPTEQDYQAVKDFARTNGLTIADMHGNRLLLDVVGPVAAVEKAFHLTLRTYRHPTEARDFFAPDTEPIVDAALRVTDVSGLDNFVRPHSKLVKRDAAKSITKGGSAPDSSGSYFGSDFRNAYVPGTTLTGAGQMVGLMASDGFYTNDIAAYAAAAGGGRANIVVQHVLLDGFNGVPTTGPNSANVEVSLDIEMAMAMAPGLSKIVVFEGNYQGNPLHIIPNDLLNAMAASNTIKNLSCSLGWGGGPSSTTDAIFQQMAAQGQSFFNASGDSDAFTVGSTSTNGVDNPSWANAPSSSPYITQVGGTTLTMNGTGASYASETVWNWDVEYGSSYNGSGSSGGISSYYSIPSWQTGISMSANLGSTTVRNIPDVALTADNIYVVCGGSGVGSGGYGGTSCAAPLWAGFTALVNQQAASLPNPSVVGFINPAIYALGKSTNYGACFHDTTTGNNYWSSSPANYPAVAGYDLCTGWGTPNGASLINALASGSANLLPLITTQPANQTVPAGNSATFSVSASGTAPFHYYWRRNGSSITGANAASYTTNNVQMSDSGTQFSCLVSNMFGSTNTQLATLTVTLPPAITVTPSSLNFGAVLVGSSTNQNLYVTNTGGGTLSGSASVPPPFNIVSGSSYSLTANQGQTVVVRYSPVSAGTTNLLISFTGASGASATVTGVAYAPPAASFTGAPGSGLVPLTVTFTDTSTGTITNRVWTFGDGGTLTTNATIVAHLYSLAGTNTVSLTVSGPAGTSSQTNANYIVATNSPALLVVHPASTNFGTLIVSQSSTQTFQVVNLGGTLLAGTATSTVPFMVVNNSSFSLSPSQTGLVQVAFSPMQAGTYTTNLIFNSNGGNATNILTGIALTPGSITVTPASTNLGIVLAGTNAVATFVVTNTGGGPVSNGVVSIGTGPFGIVSGAGFTLAGFGSTNVLVRFTSPGNGTFSTNVVFTTSNAGSSTNLVSGVGQTPGQIAVTPANWNFGWVAVGSNTTCSFAITNSGGATVTGGTVSISPPFSVVSGNNFSVAGFGTTNVVVQFAPTNAAAFSNNVVFSSVNGGNVTNILTGIAVTPGSITVTPASTNFGIVMAGTNAVATFVVTNTGGGPVSNGVVSIGTGPFGIISGAGFNLAGFGSTNVVVQFTPPGNGTFSTNVVFTTSNAGSSTNQASGVGQTPGQIAVTPANWNFGWLAVGSNAACSFIVTNSGGAAVTSGVAAVSLPFSVISGSNFTVAGFATTNVVVQFAPTNAAAFSNNVLFSSANGGSVTNAVTGNGAVVPTAGFTSAPSKGSAPLMVYFSDISIGTVTNRFWDFGDGATTNATSTNIVHSYNLAGTNAVSLVVSGPLGTSTNSQSGCIVVTNLPPAITGQPQNQTAVVGGTARFSVTTIGTPPLSYQWQFNGTNLVSTARISGATSSTLTISSVQTNDAGNFSVVVTNTSGSVTSSIAMLAITVPSPSALTCRQVAAGSYHTVAVKTDGTLWAWGYNYDGQLGDGTTVNKSSPVQVGTDSHWQSVAAGGYHTVAVKTDGTLWAWGFNYYGQLGNGTTGNKSSPVQVGTDNHWQSVTAGEYHTVAVKTDGTLWAWGYNTYGQLGDGTTTNKSSPVQVGSDNHWQSVAAGYCHTVAVKTDGTLWACGYNPYGQLGDGTIADKSSPVQVGTDNHWLLAAAGGYHTVAVKTDGTLWAWGFNTYGQLGNGMTANKSSPVQAGTDNHWQSLAAGYSHTVAVKTDGTLWAWGYNGYGQLGNGMTADMSSPVQVGTDNYWQSAAAGEYHTVAVKTDGTLWTWGCTGYGQLGNGATANKSSPVQAGRDNRWQSLAAGYSHTVAVKTDGTLWAWGYNTYGQLGDGTTTNESSPVQVGTDSHWQSVAAGGYHTVAVKTDGTLWAWGYNTYGQLGNGTTANMSSPVQVGTNNHWQSVVAGYEHTVAVKTDGTLWAWGYNGYGQLGDGTTANKSSPVQVGTDNHWQSVVAGYEHTVAVKTDGTLWAWGYNGYGQLGNGTTANISNPAQVGTDNHWQSVVAGDTHTVAVKTDNTLWAWGENDYGQLGDGTAWQAAPIQIGPPVIVVQPANITNMVGSTATFSATATGGVPLAYQWCFYGTNLVGQTATNLTLNNVQVSQAGPYTVVVTNTAGAATSSPPAQLTVLTAPSLAVSPAATNFGTIGLGGYADCTFAVTNQGGSVLSNGVVSVGVPFTVTAGSNFMLAGFGMTNVIIRFTSSSPGAFSNNVLFSSANGGSATNPVTGRALGTMSLLAPVSVGANFNFSFNTVSGFTYVVQYKNNLNDPVWLTLQSVTGDGTQQTITNSLPLTGKCFYRLTIQ